MDKKEKQINAMLYAVEQYPKIGRVKLMKFVFLVDLIWFNRNKHTLLEDNYIRMPKGPVPSLAFELTADSNKFLNVFIEELDAEVSQYNFSPKKKSNASIFSNDIIEIFNLVINMLKSSTADFVSNFTHIFRLWGSVNNGNEIPLNLFKLDDYEEAMLESKLAFQKGVKLAKLVESEKKKNKLSDEYFEIPDDIDEELMNLQFTG